MVAKSVPLTYAAGFGEMRSNSGRPLLEEREVEPWMTVVYPAASSFFHDVGDRGVIARRSREARVAAVGGRDVLELLLMRPYPSERDRAPQR